MTALINIKSLALLAWALVNAALVLAIGSELDWGESLHQTLPAPVVHPAAPLEITLPPDFRLPAREKTYAVTLERPLFVPSRSPAPPVPPPPPPPPPTMKKGQFQLLGTTITDELSIAIVKEVAGGKVRQLVLNQTINGLRLEQIEPDRIVFTQYDDREELYLKIQKSLKAPPPGKQDSVPTTGMAAPNVPQATTSPTGIPAPRAIRRGGRRTAPGEETTNQ